VTGLRGCFAYVHIADPENGVYESNEDNNEAQVIVRLPFRLGEALRDHPELRHVGRLTLLDSFRCVRLVLWDETQRRLVSFREARLAA
jgi:hypothetical protein